MKGVNFKTDISIVIPAPEVTFIGRFTPTVNNNCHLMGLSYYQKYYQKHRKEKLKYSKKYYIKNRSLRILQIRKYNNTIEGKTLKISNSQKYYIKNRIAKLLYRQKYRKENREKCKFHDQKRYLAKKNAGKLSLKTIQLVYEDNIKRFGTLTCYLCLHPIKFCKDHLEHKTPLSRGGTNEYNNLAVACQKCNLKKYNKTEEEFRRR